MIDPLVIVSFVIALCSGLLGGITGAGGALIVAPYMLLIGLPPNVAVATPKLAGIGVGIGSLSKFLQKKIIDWWWVKRLLPVTISAAFVGSFLLLQMPQWLIKALSLAFTIELAVQLLLDKKSGLKKIETSQSRRLVGFSLYFIIETIRAAIGSGIGTLNMAVMMNFFGMEAVTANAIKRFVTFPALVVGLIIFIPAGLINWPHGIALFLGTAIGGYAGAHVAIAKGNLFVKRAFLLTVVILAISAFLV